MQNTGKKFWCIRVKPSRTFQSGRKQMEVALGWTVVVVVNIMQLQWHSLSRCFACSVCPLRAVVAFPHLGCVGSTHTPTLRALMDSVRLTYCLGSEVRSSPWPEGHVSLQVTESEVGGTDRSSDARGTPAQGDFAPGVSQPMEPAKVPVVDGYSRHEAGHDDLVPGSTEPIRRKVPVNG